MNWCFLLLLIPPITALTNVNQTHYSCNNIGKCSCEYISSGIILKCTQDGQTSLQASLSSKSKSLHVSCNHFAFTKQLNSSVFDDLSELKILSSAYALSFQFCPLPSESFKSFATLVRMIRVNKIKFEYSSNAIGMLSPPYLNNLPYLEELILSENSNLTQLNMDLFQETPNLKSLFLRGNSISELYPGVFQHLRKLEVLDLGNNDITHLDSGIFRNLTSLRILNIDNNQIANLTRALFNSVPHLESLDISGNRIVTFPVGVFADLWELRTFQANKNIFKTFPSDLLSNMKKLEVVKIIHHKYSLMALPSMLFADLPELTNVTFRESNIRTVPPDVFRASTNLLMISFTGHKKITSLPRTLFKDCKALVKLDLSDNSLNDLPDEVFAPLINLYELNLSKNNFHHIKTVMLAGLTKLSRLDLNHNVLKLIDSSALDSLHQLTFLDLTSNLLDFGNSSLYSPMRSCQNLEELLLSDNRIHTIYSDWTTTLPNLRTLDLRKNKFTSVTLGAIIPSSLQLDLSHNNIALVSLDKSHPLTVPRDKVPRVILNSNPLACNCSNYDLISYTHLLLEPSVYNSLQPVTDTIVCSSTGDLFNKIVPAQVSCFVSNCPPGCYCNFWPYTSQMSVNCSSANLSQMPDYLPVTYEHQKVSRIQLILRNNSIQQLLENPPEAYDLLTELDLANNSIAHLNMHSYFHRLERLDVSRNQLEYLNSSLLALISSSNLSLIGLHDNPWLCNCNITHLHASLLDNPNKFLHIDRIACQGWTVPLARVNINEACPRYLRNLAVLAAATATLAAVGMLLGVLVMLVLRYQRQINTWAGCLERFRVGRGVGGRNRGGRNGGMAMAASENGKKENCILLPD